MDRVTAQRKPTGCARGDVASRACLAAAILAGVLVPTPGSADDERTWSLGDYLAVEEHSGDVVRPWRRQRNLMYALQDALNAQGYSAGTRTTVWKAPFRQALTSWQQANGFAPNGDISEPVIAALLGPAGQ